MPPSTHSKRSKRHFMRRWPEGGSTPWRAVSPLRRAIAPNDNPVQPGDAVMVAVKGGDKPALIQSLFTVSVHPDAGDMRVLAHVQWLISSYAGTELFLAAPGEATRACANVKVGQIQYTLTERPRFVSDGGWRDPLPPGRHRPEDMDADPARWTRCDSCLSSEAERRRREAKVDLDDEDKGVGFTLAGVEYHIGDLVFFAPSDIVSGAAWTPGILTGDSELGAEDLWLVRGCGWLADLDNGAYVDEVGLPMRGATDAEPALPHGSDTLGPPLGHHGQGAPQRRDQSLFRVRPAPLAWWPERSQAPRPSPTATRCDTQAVHQVSAGARRPRPP